MNSLHIAAALAAAFVLGCSSDSPLGVKPDAALSSSEPGKFTITADEQSTALDPSGISCPAGQGPATAAISGTLRLVNGESRGMAYTGTTWNCTMFVPPNTAVLMSAGRTMVFADGDELWLRLDPESGGRLVFNPVTLDFETFEADEVTGGTGRYAAASGHLEILYRGNLTTWPPVFSGTVSGTIASAGAGRLARLASGR